MLAGGGLLKQSLLNSFFEEFFRAEAYKFLFSVEIRSSSNENIKGEGTKPTKTFSSVLVMMQSSQFAFSSWW